MFFSWVQGNLTPAFAISNMKLDEHLLRNVTGRCARTKGGMIGIWNRGTGWP
jgi:hypothetical protein